jgi:NTE family protein
MTQQHGDSATDAPPTWPVDFLPADDPTRAPAPGTALCLSGGGSRAMLFHAGALWRLNELGLLRRLERISSVSGGSIIAGLLGVRWSRLAFDPATDMATNFVGEVVAPIRSLAGRNLDIVMAVKGLLLPGGNAANRYAEGLRKHLYGDARLSDLPADGEGPRFVINASNLQSGVLWRFSRPYAWDWRVGRISDPPFTVATAVAASGAFPPFFAPLVLEVDPSMFVPGSGDGVLGDEYRHRILLADGGVYDNLGLETVFKRYRTVYVSDGGGKLSDESAPATDWGRSTLRVMKVIDNQVRSLRKRLIFAAYDRGDRSGSYWGIRSRIDEYSRVPGALPCPPAQTMALAEIPTRLAAVSARRQKALINWGYAIADAAIRSREPLHPEPDRFPYPEGVAT